MTSKIIVNWIRMILTESFLSDIEEFYEIVKNNPLVLSFYTKICIKTLQYFMFLYIFLHFINLYTSIDSLIYKIKY